MTQLEDAWAAIQESGEASSRVLERGLGIGYAEAGRLMDRLEDMGKLGSFNGSKPRRILVEFAAPEVFEVDVEGVGGFSDVQ